MTSITAVFVVKVLAVNIVKIEYSSAFSNRTDSYSITARIDRFTSTFDCVRVTAA